jgi:hypothetical protein
MRLLETQPASWFERIRSGLDDALTRRHSVHLVDVEAANQEGLTRVHFKEPHDVATFGLRELPARDLT